MKKGNNKLIIGIILCFILIIVLLVLLSRKEDSFSKEYYQFEVYDIRASTYELEEHISINVNSDVCLDKIEYGMGYYSNLNNPIEFSSPSTCLIYSVNFGQTTLYKTGSSGEKEDRTGYTLVCRCYK